MVSLNRSTSSRSSWNETWEKLQQSPDDFEIWQDLLDQVKSLDGGLNRYSDPKAFELFRLSYDSFLTKFPYCHGYWIQYARSEFKAGSTENALKVYERAVSIMPYSVDLWTSYLQLYVSTNSKYPEKVRQLFEFGALFVGNHFLSHSFWNEYLAFEEREASVFPLVAKEYRYFKLLSRLVQLPLHQFANYFSKLQSLLPNMPLHVQATPQVLEQFQAEYELEHEKELRPSQPPSGPKNKKRPLKNTSASATEDVQAPASSSHNAASQESDMRSRLWHYYVSSYVHVQSQVAKRISYELLITRPFFHVAHLAESEFVNWRRYLQFEEIEGDHSRIKLLYERAIIPTAHRQEFWLRYYRWLTGNGYLEEARSLLQRAVTVLPITAVETRLVYAKFEEALANSSAASCIYQSILSALPSSLAASDAYANYLKRAGQNPLAWISSHLVKYDTSLSPEEKALITLLSIKYETDVNKIRAIYQQLSNSLPKNFIIWRDSLLFEIGLPDSDTKHSQVQLAFNFIRSSPLSADEKRQLAHIYMVYLLDEGKDALFIKEYLRVGKSFDHKATTIAL